jgi:hypothetical protein
MIDPKHPGQLCLMLQTKKQPVLDIISGESGAVTLGALFEIMSDKHNRKTRKDISLNSGSRVLLFSTEGDREKG